MIKLTMEEIDDMDNQGNCDEGMMFSCEHGCFSDIIVNLRNKMKMTQIDLSSKTGVTQPAISMIEKNKDTRFSNLMRILNVLNVRIYVDDMLICDERDMIIIIRGKASSSSITETDLSIKSSLSRNTVRNIIHDCDKSPMSSTIFKLCSSLKINISIEIKTC